MKLNTLRFLGVALLVGFLAGCGAIETSAGGNPDRVLNGTVNIGTGLPAGAEVVVRVMAAASSRLETPRISGVDTPATQLPPAPAREQILGEQVQTLARGTAEPVPFRVEYSAEDAVLRRGLNVEVRISVDGKVRYRTVNAHVVTLASSPFRQEVTVQPVR